MAWLDRPIFRWRFRPKRRRFQPLITAPGYSPSGTPRSLAYLLGTSFPDNKGDHNVVAADLRDLAASITRLFEIGSTPSYPDDATAAAAGVAIGGLYRNGSKIMVRVS